MSELCYKSIAHIIGQDWGQYWWKWTETCRISHKFCSFWCLVGFHCCFLNLIVSTFSFCYFGFLQQRNMHFHQNYHYALDARSKVTQELISSAAPVAPYPLTADRYHKYSLEHSTRPPIGRTAQLFQSWSGRSWFNNKDKTAKYCQRPRHFDPRSDWRPNTLAWRSSTRINLNTQDNCECFAFPPGRKFCRWNRWERTWWRQGRWRGWCRSSSRVLFAGWCIPILVRGSGTNAICCRNWTLIKQSIMFYDKD